ncbi:IclR family transcriptional regulator [Haloarchaeobius salinus]|uniref:IclR family transcriptional regulator n=1 Tax=Haloarchaeobius salinus TaxID=1198298 RepID=UPI0021091EA0|nr:IclR family transcriptional regulator [Haloarchaeobius salinus]
MTKEGRTVQSDERLFEIMAILRENNGIRITEIAEKVDLANSSVHSHLVTLEQAGYARKTQDGYHLGLKFLEYGTEAQRQQELYAFGKGVIDELAAETDEKTWGIVEENRQAVYVYGSQGDRSIKTYTSIGHRTHLHHLAAGKAILSQLPAGRVEEIVESEGLPQYTQYTITDQAELKSELEEVRERGVAFNLEESVEGLHAISAPIQGENRILGAISVSGPAHRLSKERLQTDLKQKVLGAANELEINIRAHPDKGPLFESDQR